MPSGGSINLRAIVPYSFMCWQWLIAACIAADRRASDVAMQALCHFAESAQQHVSGRELEPARAANHASSSALEDLLLYLSTYRCGPVILHTLGDQKTSPHVCFLSGHGVVQCVLEGPLCRHKTRVLHLNLTVDLGIVLFQGPVHKALFIHWEAAGAGPCEQSTAPAHCSALQADKTGATGHCPRSGDMPGLPFPCEWA